ncbi:hypothetical protein C7S13_7568 [Burkholderia cepacia]|nr:hypothetical protein [Burkholderia cepacia]
MVYFLARDAVVRDVVWGTMYLLRFVQPVLFAGKRDLDCWPGAQRKGPRDTAADIDPAILRTFRHLRTRRDRCGRNDSSRGIDAIDGGIRMSAHTRRSVAGRFTLAQSSIHTLPTAPPGIANGDRDSRRIDAARSGGCARRLHTSHGASASAAAGAISARKMAPISADEGERRDFLRRIHIMRNTTVRMHFRCPESGQ